MLSNFPRQLRFDQVRLHFTSGAVTNLRRWVQPVIVTPSVAYRPAFRSPGFSGSLIELQGDGVELGLRDMGEVGFSREVLPERTDGIFIAAALTGTSRIAEVDL